MRVIYSIVFAFVTTISLAQYGSQMPGIDNMHPFYNGTTTPTNNPYAPRTTEQVQFENMQRQDFQNNAIIQQEMLRQTTKGAQEKELRNFLAEEKTKELANTPLWELPSFVQQEQPYYTALATLQAQLQGKQPLNIKQAYYAIEQAHGNTMLNAKQYNQHIHQSTTFIKRWMIENKLNPNNNKAVHYALQRFMFDTLSIGKTQLEFANVAPKQHLPFYYDYDDYKAENDVRSYHITKTLATGNGQCHTLPIIYLILAEALNAPCYLTYAPLHSFIKYPDAKGLLHNYEVTTHWQISDQWYKEHMDISTKAQYNKLYLAPLTKKQTIASALIDLACSYHTKYGVVSGDFITQCNNLALSYFPKEANAIGLLLRNQVTHTLLNRYVHSQGFSTQQQLEQNPTVQAMVTKLKAGNAQLQNLGYREPPIQAYEQMMQESKALHPEIPTGNNLQPRQLFIALTPIPNK
ncbi:MAG: hypothetical protein H7331_05850 [Bacteroidia bacterium]|nr:hypothetical protein [Bacteroidia bacterium]